MVSELNNLRQVLGSVTDELKACKTHLRGISAYRSDVDGLAYAVNKFQSAAAKLRKSAEELESLAADLTGASASATSASDHNGREIETHI
jgi:hypothetical protein